MKRFTLAVCLPVLSLSALACSDTPKAAPDPEKPPAVALRVSEQVGDQLRYTVRFVGLAGKEIRTVKLPDNASPPAAGGDRIFFVVDGEIRSVDASGSTSSHGTFGDGTSSVERIVVSPDGQRWAWKIDDVAKGTDSVNSKIYVAGVGREKKLLLEQTAVQRVLTPMIWSPAGLVVVDMRVGIGGLIFFADTYWGRAQLVNPDTGTATPLTRDADECPLNDVTTEGSWTCISGLGRGGGSVAAPSKASVVLHRAGSEPLTLTIERKALQAGNAVISPAGDQVAVGIYTGMTGDDSYSLTTILFDTASKKQRVVTSDDSLPVAWLPDGSLVLQGSDLVRQGDTSLLEPDGDRIQLGKGDFIGYLDAAGSVATRT